MHLSDVVSPEEFGRCCRRTEVGDSDALRVMESLKPFHDQPRALRSPDLHITSIMAAFAVLETILSERKES